MGVKCCKKVSPTALREIEIEEDVNLPSFTSKSDSDFIIFENDLNLLNKIVFSDYAYSLSIYDNATATAKDDYKKKPSTYSKNDPFFKQSMSKESFQSFIENKIYMHPNIYEIAGNDEKGSATAFKEILLLMYNGLEIKMGQHTEIYEKTSDRIKKYHLMSIGILYCEGSNVSKIRFIFNVFKNGDKITISNDLKDFLLSLFLIPSYCILSGIYGIKDKFEVIKGISKERMQEILKCCELKDCVHLVDVFCKQLFGDDENGEIKYDDFKQKFKESGGIGYILSPQGIREELEKNNVL